MKCRRIKRDEQGVKHIVWFGSYGKNLDGTAKFYDSNVNQDSYGKDDNGKHNNYSDKQEAIKDSLTQRLSVIRGELWYNVSVGIPLFEKVKKKGVLDTYISIEILKHPDVEEVLEFKSDIINNHYYTCSCKVLSKYGTINLII